MHVPTALLTLLMFHGNGCGGDHDEVDTEGTFARSQDTSGGTWLVHYSPTPDPIPFNALFDLEVHVHSNETGEHVDTPITLFEAWMPAMGHDHGMNVTPTLTAREEGVTDVTGLMFHMTGLWALTLTIGEGDNAETATFQVDCCEE